MSTNEDGPVEVRSTEQLGRDPAREAFEAWFGDSPRALERDADGHYKLMQAHAAWRAWSACWPLARAAIYSAEQAQIEAPLKAEITWLRGQLDVACHMLEDAVGALLFVEGESTEEQERLDDLLGKAEQFVLLTRGFTKRPNVN